MPAGCDLAERLLHKMSRSEDVKVSIIIPIYNMEKYLVPCLDSVAAQSLEDLEIICIDDNSEDDSYKIAESYANKDDRFILLHNDKNEGLSAVRNKGIRKAVGNYIQFLDSDDYLEENTVRRLYDAACQNGVDGIFFGARVVKEDGSREIGEICYKEIKVFDSGSSFFHDINAEGEYQSASCFQFWKRQFLLDKKIYFQEGIVYEDTLFTLKAVLKAEKLMTLDAKLYFYRIRDNSISHSLGVKQLDSCVIVFTEILKMWLESRNPAEIADGIRQRLDLFERRIRYVLGQEGKQDLPFRMPGYSYLYEMFCKMPPFNSLYIRELTEMEIVALQQNENIYIYGAGSIARDVITMLEKENFLISGVVVTRKTENEKVCMGYPVIDVHEMQKRRGKGIVVLALARKWHPEIIKILEKNEMEYINILL